jgi:hypothetical protein
MEEAMHSGKFEKLGPSSVALAALILAAIPARAQAQVALNTDIRPLPPTTVQIIDQRAPEIYSDGSIVENNGVPAFIDTTTLNIDTFFVNASTKSDFQYDLAKGAAKGFLLGVGIEPAANCRLPNQGLPYGSTSPFLVPEAQLTVNPGVLANTYQFEGSLGAFDAEILALIPPYLARSAPWGNLTMTVGNGPFGIGELKMQGPANVAPVLTTPQQKVDLIIEWNDGAGPPPNLVAGLNLFDEAACVTVTPVVTINPVAAVVVPPPPTF